MVLEPWITPSMFFQFLGNVRTVFNSHTYGTSCSLCGVALSSFLRHFGEFLAAAADTADAVFLDAVDAVDSQAQRSSSVFASGFLLFSGD